VAIDIKVGEANATDRQTVAKGRSVAEGWSVGLKKKSVEKMKACLTMFNA